RGRPASAEARWLLGGVRRTPPFWMIFLIIQNGRLLHPGPSPACGGRATLVPGRRARGGGVRRGRLLAPLAGRQRELAAERAAEVRPACEADERGNGLDGLVAAAGI